VSIYSGLTAEAASTITLAGSEFAFRVTLTPQCDALGAIEEFSLQGRYAKADAIPLHKHGHSTICTFRICVPEGMAGIYALVVTERVHYIGECKDLRDRFNNSRYPKLAISPHADL
jgi:hypothetical protein